MLHADNAHGKQGCCSPAGAALTQVTELASEFCDSGRSVARPWTLDELLEADLGGEAESRDAALAAVLERLAGYASTDSTAWSQALFLDAPSCNAPCKGAFAGTRPAFNASQTGATFPMVGVCPSWLIGVT